MYAPEAAVPDANLFAASKVAPALRRELGQAEVITADGVEVNTWVLQQSEDANEADVPRGRHATWVLYCHGNNANLSAFTRRIEAIWSLGYNVVAFDYRGYGKTPGRPSEAGLYADARAVRAWLTAHKAAPERVVLYGYSLGAAICTQLASELATPLLVLEAPFASIDRLSQDASGLGLPRAFFGQDRYDNEAKMSRHEGELLIFHGAQDTYLKPAYGRRLAQAARGHARTVQFVEVPDGGHETTPCRHKDQHVLRPGDCAQGFDVDYLEKLSDSIDGAVPPSEPVTPAQAAWALTGAAAAAPPLPPSGAPRG